MVENPLASTKPPVPLVGLVLPSDVVQYAYDWLNYYQWCQGSDAPNPLSHARDTTGKVCRLYTGMASKGEMNPAAISRTAYAAILTALNPIGVSVTQLNLLWNTIETVANATLGVPVGGTNYLHAIHNVNERPGQTKSGVLTYLQSVKSQLLATQSSLDVDPVAQPIAGSEDSPSPILPEKQIEHMDQALSGVVPKDSVPKDNVAEEQPPSPVTQNTDPVTRDDEIARRRAEVKERHKIGSRELRKRKKASSINEVPATRHAAILEPQHGVNSLYEKSSTPLSRPVSGGESLRSGGTGGSPARGKLAKGLKVGENFPQKISGKLGRGELGVGSGELVTSAKRSKGGGVTNNVTNNKGGVTKKGGIVTKKGGKLRK